MLQHADPRSHGREGSSLATLAIILDYEFEMRKKAVTPAQKDNRPLHEVLREVTENTELKDLHFTSPVTLAAMQRPQKFAKQDDQS